MTKARKTQIGLIITAVVLLVLLFLVPKKPLDTTKSSDASRVSVSEVKSNLEPLIDIAVKALKPSEKSNYDLLLETAKQSVNDTAFLEVVKFWDKQKKPDFAAYFNEKIAQKLNTALAYNKAGDRYYYAIRFVKDNSEVPILYQKAIECYQKSIALDKNQIDAKIQLAACLVEHGDNPMNGIALLREVEQIDSNNVKLQLTFAFFSVKSQQWDKAIKRFEHVLRIDPAYIEAYLHLADIYEQQGQKQKTIKMLEMYAEATEDAMAKKEVLKYIDQLKNK